MSNFSIPACKKALFVVQSTPCMHMFNTTAGQGVIITAIQKYVCMVPSNLHVNELIAVSLAGQILYAGMKRGERK